MRAHAQAQVCMCTYTLQLEKFWKKHHIEYMKKIQQQLFVTAPILRLHNWLQGYSIEYLSFIRWFRAWGFFWFFLGVFIAEEVDGVGDKRSQDTTVEVQPLLAAFWKIFLKSGNFIDTPPPTGTKQNSRSWGYSPQVPDYQNFWIKSCWITGILLCKYHTLVTHKVLLKGYVIQHVCQLSSWIVSVKAELINCKLTIPVALKAASLQSNTLGVFPPFKKLLKPLSNTLHVPECQQWYLWPFKAFFSFAKSQKLHNFYAKVSCAVVCQDKHCCDARSKHQPKFRLSPIKRVK
jgi:hypothetical protein